MNMLGALFAFLFFANQSISPAYAIVGGEPAKPHEFPFLASFYLQGKWTGGCGGALISPRHVLSCAHCFKDKKAELMEVGFGRFVGIFLGKKMKEKKLWQIPSSICIESNKI